MDPTIGIVTALPKEYAAVQVLLETTKPIDLPGHGAGRRYLYGEVPSSNGNTHPVVLALLAEVGNNSASSRATLLIEHFPSAQLVIMVGIAGGIPQPSVPAKHVRLGDIVVCDRNGVVQYDFGKEELVEGLPHITHRFPPRPPSALLLESTRLLEASELLGNRPWVQWIERALQQLSATRPLIETDILASSTDPNVVIPHPVDPMRVSGVPRVFGGPIASANNLLKNPLKRDQLKEKYGVVAVEMEGSGIADAAWNADIGYFVIRGISDYCDKNKGDDWQNYAAVAAAGYLRALLESTPTDFSREFTPTDTSGTQPKVNPHEYPPVEDYLLRKVCETKDAGPYSLYLLRKDRVHDLIEIIDRHNHVVLLCDAGYGKSTELKRVAATLTVSSDRFHVETASLNKYVNQSISDLLHFDWKLVPAGEVLVLIDGLDEVESQNRKNAIRQIERFCEENPACHVVVSCRTNFYSQEGAYFSGTLQGFASYTLLDLEDEVVNGYLVNKLSGHQVTAFQKAVQNNHLHDLIRSPFYLKRLVDLYHQFDALPASRAAIFAELVNRSFEFDVEKFRTATDLPEKKALLHTTLERLAIAMETLGRNYITVTEYGQLVPEESVRELIKHSSIWRKNDKDLTWQFEHNNFQEYLAARVLSHQPIDVIKQFVAFEPRYSKLNPSWLNTIAFLASILGPQEPQFIELLSWIQNVEPNALSKFEPDKVPATIRNEYVKNIFNEYKGKDIAIDYELFSYRELARFGQSIETVSFLLDEAENATTWVVLANALNLLRRLEVPYPLRPRTAVLLDRLILDEKQESYVRYLALLGLSDLNFNTREITQQMVGALRSSLNHEVRAGLYNLILNGNYHNDYIEVFLEGIESASGIGRAGHERSLIRDALVRSKQPAALLLILQHLTKNLGLWQRRFMEDEIPVVIENAAEAFSSSDALFDQIIELLSTLLRRLDYEDARTTLRFFELTGTHRRALEKVLLRRPTNQQDLHSWYDLLGSVITEADYSTIATLNIAGALTDTDLWGIQSGIGMMHGARAHSRFNELINRECGNRFVLNPPVNHAEIRSKARQRSFQLLFDESKFLEALADVFQGEQGDTLSGKEIFTLYPQYPYATVCPYAWQCLDTLRELADQLGGTVTKQKAIEIVGKNWERFSIHEIYEYLENDHSLDVSPEQIEYVSNWCAKYLSTVDFKTAIKINPDGSWTSDWLAIKLWFFHRRFNLKYPKSLLLDMLSFESFDSSGFKGIEYFENLIDEPSMTMRILENLEAGIPSYYVFKNHLNYCVRHKVGDSIPFAVRELINPAVDFGARDVALESILEFPQARETLEAAIPELSGNTKWVVLRRLLQLNSETAKTVLRQVLSTGNEKDQLKAAIELMEIQDIDALENYAAHVEKTQQLPVPFGPYTSLEALPIFMRLLRLSYQPPFGGTDFNSFQAAVLESLSKVALNSDDNFEQVRSAINHFITENEDSFTNVKYLHQHLTRLERKYYLTRAQSLNLTDTIAKVQTLLQ
jgi:nucleoside phosphorylase